MWPTKWLSTWTPSFLNVSISQLFPCFFFSFPSSNEFNVWVSLQLSLFSSAFLQVKSSGFEKWKLDLLSLEFLEIEILIISVADRGPVKCEPDEYLSRYNKREVMYLLVIRLPTRTGLSFGQRITLTQICFWMIKLHLRCLTADEKLNFYNKCRRYSKMTKLFSNFGRNLYQQQMLTVKLLSPLLQ